ncbi:Proteasome subunit alpha/beta [Carpediemonas membranifera]|uniref:Proteasome subunit beta n=1 Tax=Carpediemonas membranifera TaxID=201153 RepID=A0A8J6B3N3_9EUKA|nr:Proteasome subunit alpha/beta [Carpediemonas membranifera]|eukprot:KAG9392294.1 Proteasome subunit alpha/beta [Carpediemonas membranifera]
MPKQDTPQQVLAGLTSKNQFTKTGTTICGVICKNGVVLGADTRSTAGDIVMDKNCEKIHYIAPNIYCCGAGTAADTEYTTELISSQCKLHRYRTDRDTRVATAKTMLTRHLFQYQGHVSAALVLGGVDVLGPHLHTIYPHGSTDTLPFVAMGSGSLAAISMLEQGDADHQGWRPNMEVEEAVDLVKRAIHAGIFNDMGSGSNVDICVITKDEAGKIAADYRRNTDIANPRKYRRDVPYKLPATRLVEVNGDMDM